MAPAHILTFSMVLDLCNGLRAVTGLDLRKTLRNFSLRAMAGSGHCRSSSSSRGFNGAVEEYPRVSTTHSSSYVADRHDVLLSRVPQLCNVPMSDYTAATPPTLKAIVKSNCNLLPSFHKFTNSGFPPCSLYLVATLLYFPCSSSSPQGIEGNLRTTLFASLNRHTHTNSCQPTMKAAITSIYVPATHWYCCTYAVPSKSSSPQHLAAVQEGHHMRACGLREIHPHCLELRRSYTRQTTSQLVVSRLALGRLLRQLRTSSVGPKADAFNTLWLTCFQSEFDLTVVCLLRLLAAQEWSSLLANLVRF
ncbi:hypothetical protein HRR86_009608 [Exophiala dermatitidis]|uniref:Uncharacterized protein n=1 Tax=Exophiala dermatitidis (strain ATCC 34100 / CBS 525.76 / NIH/UT8656) TaxID=858893 RepID=H6BZA5_EXODN|nr:uncharacterized protein HMPREF1120_05025 [Exophiala dermatitidis NIH/UT8656]XP_009157429.1 hypothetical protein, variant 1 [Exophiala dermatitidis NIH/UT8656]KAJ4586147.1 hypothetical protein HRR82_009596 [Exophiala dermatitidis]EHY56967.1 hypothetical protein, variant 1 [Exophiala dermatitidis NIH/UT8656]EHY56968.1 hypothetical protein HMPREF1120_05025 [Exophiala dermatitidis NIH/UT8656]KAJ4619330.1 hypothetical protein HRR85_009612 [Exophiala dermatitidis]KAJ4634052.1 hypothetical protei